MGGARVRRSDRLRVEDAGRGDRGMSVGMRALLAGAWVLVTALGVGWVGLQITPGPLPPHPEGTRDRGVIELPADLPAPAYRHFRSTLGEQPPKVKTAVVWGRLRLRKGALWLPGRFKAYYVPGQEFSRQVELTWFGLPILQGSDSYLRGQGACTFGGRVESGERVSESRIEALWAEAVWMPSAFITAPQARWEAVDSSTARLLVPFRDREEALTFRFDPQTGLMTEAAAVRRGGQQAMGTPWRIEYGDWQALRSLTIPTQVAVTWEGEGRPWLYATVDGVEYNVDVSGAIPQ